MRLHEAAKARRTADAWRWAGARLSTVGRVVPSGPRRRLGRPVGDPLEPAKDYLRRERSVPPIRTMRDLGASGHPARPAHWSEVPR